MGSIQFKRLACLDNLEILHAADFESNFPDHFHDQVCLTLVQKGFECTEVEGQQLLSPTGYISLTHENEVHANPNLNSGTYSFITYYLSPDLLRSLNKNKNLRFRDRVIGDTNLFQSLSNLAERQDRLPEASELMPILQRLVDQYQLRPAAFSEIGLNRSKMEEVLVFIENNLEEKIHLEELARICNLSKFQFLRAFKKSKGITPAAFLINKRIEKAKSLLKQKLPIVEVSLACGFFDQSHFYKYFLRYVGITPAQYSRSCNILQE